MSAAWTVSGICYLAAALLVITWGLWEMRRPCMSQPAVEPDAVWLADQPHEVDTEALMNAEFVSIISAEWYWTEDAT